jgi:hypothetical protein
MFLLDFEPFGLVEPFFTRSWALVSPAIGISGDWGNRSNPAYSWPKKKGSPVGADEPLLF